MTWQRIPMKERIERNCTPEALSGCWLWTSSLDSDGYGTLHNRTQDGPKNLKAHRVSYQEFIGPIPDGSYVCHSCDVPSCVNPAHLWLGTHEENQRDRVTKGRSAKGRDFKRSHLTEEIIPLIRAAEGTMREIGVQFGIAPQTVHQIKHKTIWKHV